MKRKLSFCLFLQLCLFCMFTANAFAHTDISIPDANIALNSDPNIILVDVRELSEYCGSLGHVPGALSYPWNSGYLSAHYTDFDVNDILYIICLSGGRSNSAANFLDGLGYNYVYDITGGTNAWVNTYGYTVVGCVDSDEDGINDDLDNCPSAYNPQQADADDDGVGNCCDDNFPDLDGLDPVDFYDFAILANNWFLSDTNILGDFNDDDTVDTDDLQIMTQFWLKNCDDE